MLPMRTEQQAPEIDRASLRPDPTFFIQLVRNGSATPLSKLRGAPAIGLFVLVSSNESDEESPGELFERLTYLFTRTIDTGRLSHEFRENKRTSRREIYENVVICDFRSGDHLWRQRRTLDG